MVRPALIMLVEDNEDHAELTIEVLKNYSVVNEVRWFTDGESALNYLLGNRESHDDNDSTLPDVILLDVKLPGISGFEVLDKIKTTPKTKHIPTIMLTTSKRDEEIARGYDCGSNSYIVKPVSFSQFRKKIADLGIYWVLTSELPKPVSSIPRSTPVATKET